MKYGNMLVVKIVKIDRQHKQRAVGAFVLALSREQVKRPGAMSSAPVEPIVRWCNDVSIQGS